MAVAANQVLNKAGNLAYRGPSFCAAVFTIFNDDLTINTEIIPKYTQFLVGKGVTGILVNGTTGEGMSLSISERKLAAEAWAQAAKAANLHLMVQVGGCPFPHVIELAAHAEKIGADSLLTLPELYYSPSKPAHLVNYLKLIGEAAPKTSLIYYHSPNVTGVNLDMVAFFKEVQDKIPTFGGIKFASNDLHTATAALRAAQGKYKVFIAVNSILSGAFLMGFDSALPSTMNVYPDYPQKIRDAIKENKMEEAQELQQTITDLCSAMTSNNGEWVPNLKQVMSWITPINVGKVRPPLTNLTQEQIDILKASLKKVSLIK